MTPSQIEMLLHYHTRDTDYPNLLAPARSDALWYLVDHGYLEKRQLAEDSLAGATEFKATDKLHAYCEALCRVPEPRQAWVVYMEVKS